MSRNLGPICLCKVGEDCGSFHLPLGLHFNKDTGIRNLPPKLTKPLKYIDLKDTVREKGFNFSQESLNCTCVNIDRAVCSHR